MQNTSTPFKIGIISTKRTLAVKAVLQTADATIYNLGSGDIVAGSLSVDSACFQAGIELGSTMAADCSIGLNNADGRWNNIILDGATLWPYSGLVLPDTTTEYVKLGTFIIDEPGRPYSQLTLQSSDRMILLDEPFSAVTRTFPATNAQVLTAISAHCNVPLASSIPSILNAAYSITTRSTDDITCRDVVGMIAMMAAGFARINRDGELEIVQLPNLSGTIDLEMPVGSRYEGFKQTSDAVTVTGLTYADTDETVQIGTDAYSLQVDQIPILQDNRDTILQSIFAVIGGYAYTGFTCPYPGNPAIDVGDSVRHVTMDGKTIVSLVASHNFVHGGKSTMEATAKSQSSMSYKGANARRLSTIAAKIQTVDTNLTTYQQAQAQFTDLLTQAMGYFTTEVLQEDGSTIHYEHDHPLLADSVVIYKKTSTTMSWTPDAGAHWYGMTAEGNILARVLTAIGINAEWVHISGASTYATGYDPSTKETPAGAQAKATVAYDAAATLANAAQADATIAKTYTDNLASDTVITPDEKLTLKPKWDEIVAEGFPALTNLIPNGDFWNGTAPWGAVGGTLAVVNGELEFTESTANSEHLVTSDQLTTPVAGHKYYFGGLNASSSAGVFIVYNLKSNGSYEAEVSNGGIGKQSGVFTCSSVYSSPNFFLRLYGIGGVYTGTGAKHYFDNISMYDLTDEFCNGIVGTGLEPTAAQFEAMQTSFNLFNKSTVTTGYYVEYYSGNLAVLPGFYVSDWIEVLPNAAYKATGVNQNYAQYDQNKTYITTSLPSELTFTFATASNCKYIRLSIPNIYLDTAQCVLAWFDGTYAYGKIPAQALSFGVSDSTFDSAFANLHKYLINDLDMFTAMGTAITGLVRATWDLTWNNYYGARTDLLNAIATKAKSLADAAQTSATNATTVANAKNKTFYTQPTPPYYIDDIWQKQQVPIAVTDIVKCTVTRLTGVYTAADWANAYTSVEIAAMGSTIITGGHISTSLLTSPDGLTYLDLVAGNMRTESQVPLYEYPAGTPHYEKTVTRMQGGLLVVDTITDAANVPMSIGQEVSLFEYSHSNDNGASFESVLQLQAAISAPEGSPLVADALHLSNTGISVANNGVISPLGANVVPLWLWMPLTFIGEAKSSVIDLIYPIGSIYMSVTYSDPAWVFGGTWSQLQNQFLLGAGSSYSEGETGGETTHVLTTPEIAAHNHVINLPDAGSAGGYASIKGGNYGPDGTHTLTTDMGGLGEAHNNMPPYLVVYMWKRIS